MKAWQAPLGAAAAAMLAGCGTVVTSVPSKNDVHGLVYALPKGQVQVHAHRKRVEAEELAAAKKRLSDAKAAALVSAARSTERTDAQKQARKEADAAAKAATQPGATEAVAAVKVAKEREAALADLLLLLAKEEDGTRQAAVKKHQAEVEALDGQVGKWVESLTLSVLPNVPDTAHRFVLQHAESPARDDKLKFEVSNGLLSGSSAESTGQMSAILLNVARVLGAAAAPAFKVLKQQPAIAPQTSQGQACEPYDVEVRFDPSDSRSWEPASRRLSAKGWALEVLTAQAGDPSPSSGLGHTTESIDGLVYRGQIPLKIEVRAIQLDDSRVNCPVETDPSPARVSGLFPDASTRFALPIQGAAFAKVSAKYAFKDGMPVSAEIDRPSQLVAITALPVDILKALISVPADLIKLRVDYSSAAAAQAEAQVREAKAQQDLIKALEDLEAARKAAAAAAP